MSTEDLAMQNYRPWGQIEKVQQSAEDEVDLSQSAYHAAHTATRKNT